MKYPDRVWTTVAVVLMILPFAALGFELIKTEGLLTVAVFGVMALLLIGTLVAGLRVKPTAPNDDRDAATPARTQR